MASYPCESCGAMVEITGKEYDLRCKKCGEKRPFKCSKCQKQIGIDSVYHPERLASYRKPIFCNECGSDADFVTCSQCTQTLMRANSIEKTVNGKPHYYHKQCYEEAVKLKKRTFYACLLLCPILAYVFHGWILDSVVMYIVGALIGLIAAFKISNLFAPK